MTNRGRHQTSLVTGAAIYLVANILNAAIPFLLMPVLTRFLAPEEYGQVAMFQVLVAGLGAFVGLNAVGAANRRFFDQDEAGALPSYLGGCLVILLASFLFVWLILAAFLPFFSSFFDISPLWVLLAPVAAASLFIVKLRLGQWRVRQNPIAFGGLQIGMSVLNAVLSLLLVVVFAYGAEGRMAGQLIAPLIFSLLALVLLYKDKLLRFRVEKEHIKDALRFGVPLIPHVLGAFLLLSVDRLIINQELGLGAAGVYMVAAQLAMAVSICADAFNKAYSPWLMGQLKKADHTVNVKIVGLTYLYFLGALLAAALGFVLGPWLVVQVAGDKYEEAGKVVGFLIAGQCVKAMYQMVVNYILYAKKTGRLSTLTIISGVTNIILMLLLVPRYGLEGAGYAFLASAILLFCGGWMMAAKAYPMPWVKPWK